jgi:cellulose synthase/poly-beta-1,6-N-acetylglucosamine synthase-like glycosyltransferase
MELIEAVLIIVGIYLAVYVLYLQALIVSSFVPPQQMILDGHQTTRFAILVPAHDEELLLGRLLTSINRQDYPVASYEAIVVADNCTDRTVTVAGEYGATVLERHDLTNAGKGYALKYGLDRIALEKYDAVVVVDADCTIDSNVLKVFDSCLHSGKNILQSLSAPVNPDQSWFTRLINISFTVSNEIILKGKRRLGFSIPLMGQGMCFSAETLKRYNWSAFSIGEDLEFYAKLISGGELIWYAKEARVFHQESHNFKQATSQRLRWSSGRFAIVLKYGFRLLFVGMYKMDFRRIDGALSLVLPNPSLGINLTICALLCSAVFLIIGLHGYFVIWFIVLLVLQAGFFMSGILYMKEKKENLKAVVLAPVFLAWKMGIDLLSMLGISGKKWIPTKRIDQK